jgi:hypothetical protein
MIPTDAVLIRDSEPFSATVKEEVIMLSLRGGAYFGLNPVGSEIWNMLAQPRRLGDLCATLSQIYDADADTIIRETSDFVEALLARGLVRVVNPEAKNEA